MKVSESTILHLGSSVLFFMYQIYPKDFCRLHFVDDISYDTVSTHYPETWVS